ncbi:oligosaccharide flippase family protein [uncultured Flavobacterium sp.]|uniref:oligosaccharide flippase family protein n=1 Tax=uncultured Flavobacterium sp. TaxID=165435 RepID=UPI0030C85C3B
MLNRITSILFKNKQFHKLSVYGFGQLFNLVTPLIVVPYIVNICGEENFGKTAVGMAIAFFLIVFVDYGSDIVGVREISINRDNHANTEKIFLTTYAVKFVILMVVLLIATLCFFYIPYFRKEKILFVFSLSVLIGQFVNPTWFLQGVENVKWITLLNIISKVIYLTGIFLTVKVVEDYIYINLWWGLGMIIANLFVLLLIFKKYSFNLKVVSFLEIKKHLKNDFSMFSSQIFVSLQLYAPVIMVSYFGSNLMAGQYKIIEQIIVIFKTYIFLFFNFIFPKVCYEVEHTPNVAFRNWKIYNGLNFLFVLTGMIFFYVFSYEIVSYFNPTNRYFLSELLEVAIFIPLLMAISTPLKQLVLAFNYKKFYIRLTAIMVIISLLLIRLVIPSYEVYGVLYSLIFTEIIIIIFYLSCVRKNTLKISSN